MAEAPGSLLASKQWTGLIRSLDAALQEAVDCDRQRLLLNRGFCLQQLGLYRKALKDYEAVLAGQPGQAAALLSKAKVHVALKQLEEAQECLEELGKAADLAADMAVHLEGQLLAAALAAGEVKEGAKLPLLPALAPPAPPPPPPPPAPAPAPAKPAAAGFAPGFLSAPAKQPAQAMSSAAPAAAAAPPTPAGSAGSGAASSAAAALAAAAPAAGSASPLASQGGAASSGTSSAGQPAAAAAGPPPIAAGVDPLHKLIARADAAQGLALAVQLVNDGSCREAASLLDLLLYHHPGNVGAFAARGTARALLGELSGAVEDFSAAIQLEPSFADFYKRRSQALAALGEDERAAADVQSAISLSPDAAAKAECHEDLGRLHQKAKDYRRAEQEFRVAASLAPAGPRLELLTALGLCQEGIATYEAALKLDATSKDLWLNLGMACKELCWVERAEQALRKAARLAGKGGTAVHAYRLLAQMKQGLGDHLGAVRELNRGIAATDKQSQRIELQFLRGACHHAVGLHRQAVEDYQQTLEAQDSLDPGSTTSGELVSFICLAFYQKEMALYVRKNLDSHVLSFCVDADLHPEFKELWCKKGPPSGTFVSMYRAIMQPQHPNWSAPKPPPPPAEQLGLLLEAADAVGKLVQYSHQGFLPNKRQQRMAGLAAIEFAQALQQLAADKREGRPTLVDNAGASVSARRHSRSGRHEMGWRDAMDVIVRWRQLAEPNDQVIWVDLLTEREFNAGFGSHTPMFTGQTKCVRYYMIFHRAMAVMKRVLAAERKATNASNAAVELDTEERQAAAQAAETAEAMWKALGSDCWVVVPIESTTRPGHTLEGTRLTVVSMCKQAAAPEEQAQPVAFRLGNGVRGAEVAQGGEAAPPKPRPQPDAYEFSIRTPVTPARWDDYHQARPPPHYQTDWEAILESRPASFIASVAPWMYPPELSSSGGGSADGGGGDGGAEGSGAAGGGGGGGGGGAAGDGSGDGGPAGAPPPPCTPVDQLPKVIEVLHTMRARLEALNGGDVPRI
ncbi:hypothetical protein CHLNCDRAFT_133703 [Chlorella variabilis]|uniref:Uncharacterized protein n=1 Tax=Chlorella variabilis TaxID=554065 RepID=E1Z3M1_CHLVA|nr:hypothetical protein CHLNCDRAFT_133703 [Chlorella variabilis]EFN60188.1 hypothetical protein CHLNCDRAFT_133703 [Chlorella variabilis]|eukprot:XP_005852290.1 hypothetical protein CHLNCDRAFT_133703 [Chlorella variabilis]